MSVRLRRDVRSGKLLDKPDAVRPPTTRSPKECSPQFRFDHDQRVARTRPIDSRSVETIWSCPRKRPPTAASTLPMAQASRFIALTLTPDDGHCRDQYRDCPAGSRSASATRPTCSERRRRRSPCKLKAHQRPRCPDAVPENAAVDDGDRHQRWVITAASAGAALRPVDDPADHAARHDRQAARFVTAAITMPASTGPDERLGISSHVDARR